MLHCQKKSLQAMAHVENCSLFVLWCHRRSNGLFGKLYCVYCRVFCVLGGFPGATGRVIATNRDAFVESSIASMAGLWESHPHWYKQQLNRGFS